MKRLLPILLLMVPGIAAADSQPAMYTVQGKHNVLHLVGTVHMLQQADTVPANINKAYSDAKQLLMEIDTSNMDPMTVQELVMTAGGLPEDETLESRVGATNYSRVKNAAESAGIDMVMLDHMRPWLVALKLEETIFTEMGFDPDSGIETQLTKLATRDNKPINGLETMNEQISFFANLDEKTELDYLTSTLDELNNLRSQLDELVGAWKRGDEARLVSMLQKELNGHERFYSTLIFERNRRWISQLQKLLDNSSDNYLVAVGALHLVGSEGVVTLLRNAGYKVTRD